MTAPLDDVWVVQGVHWLVHVPRTMVVCASENAANKVAETLVSDFRASLGFNRFHGDTWERGLERVKLVLKTSRLDPAEVCDVWVTKSRVQT